MRLNSPCNLDTSTVPFIPDSVETKHSKNMHQNKDVRRFKEECCHEVIFNNVAINGNVEYKQESPNSFDVYLTQSTLKKLKRHWLANMLLMVMVDSNFLSDRSIERIATPWERVKKHTYHALPH